MHHIIRESLQNDNKDETTPEGKPSNSTVNPTNRRSR